MCIPHIQSTNQESTRANPNFIRISATYNLKKEVSYLRRCHASECNRLSEQGLSEVQDPPIELQNYT
jgi:hypothetical protein